MANNGGRKKNIKSGTASGMYKKGSGLGSGKPVGRADGYSGRTGGNKPRPSGAGSRPSGGFGGYSGGTQRAGGSSALGGVAVTALLSLLKSNKKARTIAIILVVVLVLYFILGGGNSCAGCLSMQSGLGGSYGIASGVASGDNATSHEVDQTVASGARDKRTAVVGNGQDTHTIMVYMCGTDLESKHGMATADLKEMINATISSKINLLVETGGATRWQNKTISTNKNQIYKVTGQGLILQAETEKKPMTDPNTLSEFIKYGKQNFPANRYSLIFWDHGGGSISGYGYDELFPNGSMTLDKVNKALKDGGCTFDFIGFDACLMATLESALVCEKYADYMIASEETEPGVGWYYTNWLTKLSENPSMSTVELGKYIIDDFTSACLSANSREKTTLSIIDLAELSGTVPESFSAFAQSTSKLVESGEYQKVSDARSTAKEFQSGLNQVDLIDLAQRMGTTEATAFAQTLKSCVKYNRTSSNIANANGISIYFPYGKDQKMKNALNTYEGIDMDDSYCQCIKDFSSVTAGGQIAAGTGGSLTDSLFGGGSSGSGGSLIDLIGMLGGSSSAPSSGGGVSSDLIGTALQLFLSNSNASQATGISVGQDAGWFDKQAVLGSADFYAEHYLDPERLVATQTEEGAILDLTDEEWALVQDILLNVFVDDGSGYIDLGMDNVYETDDNGDLILDYDNTWLTINGQVISYYMMSYDKGNNGQYVITGRCPILLNGDRYDLILVFDNEHEDGMIVGAQVVYDGETETIAKGLRQLEDGDAIDFLCDYYGYDQSYQDSYLLGERLTVDGELEIANMDLGEGIKKVTYCLTDLYGNELWTDAIEQGK